MCNIMYLIYSYVIFRKQMRYQVRNISVISLTKQYLTNIYSVKDTIPANTN